MGTPEQFDPHSTHLNLPPNENRDSKYYGIKFFSGTALPNNLELAAIAHTLRPEQLREEYRVWRPEETIEAARIMFDGGRVHVIGEPQSGKGTILFGLSEVCHMNGWGYVFIDGHHQNAPADVVVDAIREANQRRIAIFFDSFDYLFARSKVRMIPKEAQVSKAAAVVSALQASTTPVAITSHNMKWAKEFVNLELMDTFRSEIEEFPKYEIPLNLRSRESIVRFFVDHGVAVDDAWFLVTLDENPDAINALTHYFGDEVPRDQVFEAMKNFPVLKELVRARREEFDAALAGIRQDSPEGLEMLADIVREAEMKRVFLTTLRKRK